MSARRYTPRTRAGSVYRRGNDYLVIEDVVVPDNASNPGDVTVYYVSTYADVETRNGPTYPRETAACYEELRDWWSTLGTKGGYYKVQPADIPPAWAAYFRRHSEAFRKRYPTDAPAPVNPMIHPYEPFPSGGTTQLVNVLPPFGGPVTLSPGPAPARWNDSEIGHAVANLVRPGLDKAGDVWGAHSFPDGGRFRFRIVWALADKIEIEDIATGARYDGSQRPPEPYPTHPRE